MFKKYCVLVYLIQKWNFYLVTEKEFFTKIPKICDTSNDTILDLNIRLLKHLSLAQGYCLSDNGIVVGQMHFAE